MTVPTMPVVSMPDSKDNIMARDGSLVGFTRRKAVWRFGYLPESAHAKAHRIHVTQFMWVMSTWSGKELGRWWGYALALPPEFKAVLDGNWGR